MARTSLTTILIALLLAAAASVLLASKETAKEPAVAGVFYPAEPYELKKVVSAYLAAAPAMPVDGRLVALIAPHAGYPYSGRVAAYAYRHITDRAVDTVILIGASHYAVYAGASVYAEGSWRTPLGTVSMIASSTPCSQNKGLVEESWLIP